MIQIKLGNTVSGIIFITIFSQVIAFVRESIFAYYYGTSLGSDAYVMASQIPVTLFAVVSTSISTVILPIYTMKKERENQEAAQVFLKSSIVLFSSICIGLILVCEVFPEPIVKLFAPSFSGESLTLTIQYMRVLLPTILATVVTSILTVYYNAQNQFLYPTVVSLSHNATAIVTMFFFADSAGVNAIVWGTVIGIVLNACLLLFPHFDILCGKIDLKNTLDDVKHVLGRVIPITIGVGIAEINRIIDRAIASGLDTGSITALNYANKLSVVFSALVLSAVTTVSFKTFSELYVKKKHAERNNALVDYTTLLMMILIPLTIGASLLKKELILVAFGRGAFDISSINQTSNIFFYYALGIVFIAVREILSKFFYSSGNTKTPVINAGIGITVNIVLNLILSKPMGASGLALATTISNIAVCILLFLDVVRRERDFPVRTFLLNFVKIMISSVIMLGILIIISSFASNYSAIIHIVIYSAIGVFAYFISFALIDRQLLKKILNLLVQRFSI